LSADPTATAGDPDLVAGGAGNDLIYGQGGSDCSNTVKDLGINPNWCPDRNQFTIVVAGITSGPYIAELEGQGDLDRLHGGTGNDRVDGGGPATGGNALVGYTGTDLCSFGPGGGDKRDISCELPVANPDDRVDIPWETWDWKLFTTP
jgi:Ca2+-binding RTX toxin-like protein